MSQSELASREHVAREVEKIRRLLSTAASDAFRRAERLRAAYPEAPAALRIFARAARVVGRGGDADEADLHAIRLSMSHPVAVAAHRALVAGALEEAERTIRPYLQTHPDDAGAALILGTIAERCDAVREAENLFRRAILLAPPYVEARIALSRLLITTGRSDEAMETLDALLDIAPDHAFALAMRARVLWQARRMDEAEVAYRTLLSHYPRDGGSLMNLGHLLKTCGRMDAAIVAYRQAVVAQPELGIAWWGLANLKTMKLGRSDVAAMTGALQTATDDSDRIHLHFALGKALGDLSDFARSFEHYDAGSAIRRAGAPYSAAAVHATVKRAEQVLDRSFFAQRVGWGAPAADPIFIVSLPRSGSTLIEQILASHSQVEGTEELSDIERIAKTIGRGGSDSAYLDHVAALTEQEVRAAGEHYLEATRRFRRTDEPFFTDKMPGNWRFVGLINLILPNAKIIDIRRHPMACGLANYTQHYNRGNDFSYDLTDIGRFYGDYMSQMAHIDRVLPGRVHRIVYEDLVTDPGTQIRALLHYLDLPFEKQCLRFYENDRAVHTPSAEQVRRPINGEGLERWHAYAEWLGPLERALGPALASYPHAPSR